MTKVLGDRIDSHVIELVAGTGAIKVSFFETASNPRS
jgi:hypothetical protein